MYLEKILADSSRLTEDFWNRELTSLEWLQVILTAPECIPFVRWDALDGEAWVALIIEDFSYAAQVPWEKISARMRKRLLRFCPNLEIPEVWPLPQLDRLIRLQTKTPFRYNENDWTGSVGFYAIAPETGNALSGCVDIVQMIRALMDDGDADMLVCGCGEAGCHGIWRSRVWKTRSLVHWSVSQNDMDFALYFDRDMYDESALRTLQWLSTRKWNRAIASSVRHGSKAKFEEAIEKCLNSNVRLREIWDQLENAP